MLSFTWSRVQTSQVKLSKWSCCSLTAISDNQLVLHGGSRSGVLDHTWIMDVTSRTWNQWKQYAFLEDHPRYNHTGSLGLNRNVIIVGGGNSTTYPTYRRTFHVRLEPDSLEQLAMKTIYNKRDLLPWECLPSKLIARLGLPEIS